MFRERKLGNALFDKDEKPDCKRQHTRQESHQVIASFSWSGNPQRVYPMLIGCWSKHFLAGLHSLDLSTEYGRKTLELHLEQFVRLRKMLLQETCAIRGISRKVPFDKPIRLLTSVLGIGVTTASTLMVELDDIVRFKNADQLASFIGLVPMCHSSGESNDTGDITVRRHFMIRCLLMETA